ncbi:pseudouridine synthase [Pleionea sediminis]|uniref:pseudouridine synthase n=1 Tax=Pleionea sediminis TaxID=2569479 RepID=UPI001185419F|nr:pseudouridine synthase [Pleionea sediminis]
MNRKIVLFNKPYNTLCQFTGEPNDDLLSNYITEKGVYAAGRLDKDSEGLLVLTNDGKLQHKITDPKHKQAKVYWVQVEGVPDSEALDKLSRGVKLKDGWTRPASAKIIATPNVWERSPPVRFRKNIPTTWLELTLKEGKNRQVRRMTAAVGYPTLRLIRAKVGHWELNELQPGEFKIVKH